MKMFLKSLLALQIILSASACSEHRTETTRTVTNVDAAPDDSMHAHREMREVSVEKTSNVERHGDSCSGILSCTVDFLGDVIAFPFRLVGGLVKAIF